MKKAHTLSFAIGAAFIAATLSPVAFAADNPFAMQKPSTGYQLAEHDANMDKMKDGKCGQGMKTEKKKEGKCGEGKCGAGMMKKKTEAGKCGASMEKTKDGKCGAGMKAEEKK
ncbi:MAG: hypothetical protein HZB64_08415 [Rhodocyclales bacterium]|nr:hypothetical protein [Rhodocyclales bacterium]